MINETIQAPLNFRIFSGSGIQRNDSDMKETVSPMSIDIPIDSNFAWLVISLFVAMVWVIYITYYNARVLGQILTRICNRFIGVGYINIGNLNFHFPFFLKSYYIYSFRFTCNGPTVWENNVSRCSLLYRRFYSTCSRWMVGFSMVEVLCS
jgi:hypothetical protein